MKIVPLDWAGDHLPELIDQAERVHERYLITRQGGPAAVLIAHDVLTSLEETIEVLASTETLAAIREGLDDLAAGNFADVEMFRTQSKRSMGLPPT